MIRDVRGQFFCFFNTFVGLCSRFLASYPVPRHDPDGFRSGLFDGTSCLHCRPVILACAREGRSSKANQGNHDSGFMKYPWHCMKRAKDPTCRAFFENWCDFWLEQNADVFNPRCKSPLQNTFTKFVHPSLSSRCRSVGYGVLGLQGSERATRRASPRITKRNHSSKDAQPRFVHIKNYPSIANCSGFKKIRLKSMAIPSQVLVIFPLIVVLCLIAFGIIGALPGRGLKVVGLNLPSGVAFWLGPFLAPMAFLSLGFGLS